MPRNDGGGGCIVSKNIIEEKGELKWCVREKGINDLDTGWRFLSSIDTDEYLSNSENMCIYNYDTVVEIEPAILLIYDLPVGTDVTLIREGKKKFFVDTATGEKIYR